MTHQPDIWTGEVRRVLYARLVQLFGAYSVWTKTSSPGGEHDTTFNEFCNSFVLTVGARSGVPLNSKFALRYLRANAGALGRDTRRLQF
jgi:hypothetical protein